ncbi:MAG: DUF3158 family protein [Gammaproteobacteria bacterium]|nr:DUF3158 family protein [Gammaproteobacteria bacterium]
MYQNNKDIIGALDQADYQLNQLKRNRDALIQSFDESLGKLRLPMRLRKRSGGQLAWRNIATRSRGQRDLDLSAYKNDLVRMPQPIQRQLMNFERKRIVMNLNLSLVQHERQQLRHAATKIDLALRYFDNAVV